MRKKCKCIAAYFLVLVMLFRFAVLRIFTSLGRKLMADKYKNPKTAGDHELSKMLPKKIAYRFYNGCFACSRATS